MSLHKGPEDNLAPSSILPSFLKINEQKGHYFTHSKTKQVERENALNGIFLKLKTKSRGLSDGLRVLGALAEAPGSVPSTDMKVHTVCLSPQF